MFDFGQISSDKCYLKKRILKSQEKHGFVDLLFLCDHGFCTSMLFVLNINNVSLLQDDEQKKTLDV